MTAREVELPDEIRGGVVQECPADGCTHKSAHLMQHMAQRHPELREKYRKKRVRVYIYDERGDTHD